MQVLICDSKKINYFNIPNIVEDNFTINYNYSNTKETINLISKNGQLYVESSPIMKIYSNNNLVDRATITEYSKYRIHFDDINIDVSLVVIPNFEKYFDVNTNDSDILISATSSGNIIYNDPNDTELQVSIKKATNYFLIQNLGKNSNLYINKKRVQSSILKTGDVIFINGLKIIWMDSFIRINNPNNLVNLQGLSVINREEKNTCLYTPATEVERISNLYSDDQMFFHTPRLKTTVEKEYLKIDIPPEKDNTPPTPMILSIGSSAIIGITSCITGISAIEGLATKRISQFDAILELVMCVLMLVACLVFPMLIEKWQNRQQKKLEQRRQKRYKEYLKKKNETINKIIITQEEILRENNITLEEMQKRIRNKSASLWNREILDDDFLTVRLGTGDIPAEIEIELDTDEFSMYDDNLIDEAQQIKNAERKLRNVPITISMVENKITSFIINSDFKQNYIDSIMLQILYYYSALDLKIVVFTNKENEEKWDYLKYLPHNFSSDRKHRFFASDENEILQVSMYLEQEYDKRVSGEDKKENEEKKNSSNEKELYKNFSEYYLIITDDFKEVKDIPIVKKVLNSNINAGFSLMIVESKLNNLPSRLEKFVEISDNACRIFNRSLNTGQSQFKLEYIQSNMINYYAPIIANIPIPIIDQDSGVPTSLTFLDMYNAGKIDQLNILSRWSENDPTTTLNANVGLKAHDKFIGLDLHEKYHGPHGLIAGSTGSGKSEFIITYILSMAVNYHPDEVQFILIDYKGGGLAGAFENRETGVKLPHLVGTITNLDASEMHRTLVSIKSEMQSRQVIFNEVRDMLGEGTIDIYKYQRLYREGKVKKPIAHLFVISDEFAELKQQQPDFMAELISTARIGRSLGVHLILATQKPSGVVDDQIWSNSHFKVCLKVQTTEDSMEMLKRPEASEIKEAGRFYLQVGNDELFELGQSAWAGAKYIPADRVVKKVNDSIDFISNDGSIIKNINNQIQLTDSNSYGEQLPNIVKYLYDLSVKENINFKSLWLPSIPADIYLNDLVKKYNYGVTPYEINPIIGEYDKPANQFQGLYTLNLNSQNTIVFGVPGSGKENLLSNIIYSSCVFHSPSEVNFYILDFGSEVLHVFNKMPHVGDFISSIEKPKVMAQFEFLENEIRRRKDLFSDYSGSYSQYCKESGNKVPLIVTIVNAYEGFMENCSEYDDYFVHLLREGSKYGIVFVVSAVSTNSVRSNVLEYFNNKIILQTADPFDYQYILGAEQGTTPLKTTGRGLTIIDEEATEFQTANITLIEKVNETISNNSKVLMEKYNYKAPEIRVMPSVVKLDRLFRYTRGIDKIPLGYSRDRVELTYYDFMNNRNSLIVGPKVIDNMTFMGGIIDLIDSIKGIKLNVIDIITCIETDGKMSYYNVDFMTPFLEILDDSQSEPVINVFLGIGEYKNNLNEDEIEAFNSIMNNLDTFKNQTFIFIDNYNSLTKIIDESWFKNINTTSGIWVGNDIDMQTVFKLENLNTYDAEESFKDIIYKIIDNKYEVIKGIGVEEEDLF